MLLKEAAKDRLYVMSHSLFERRQLVFPMDTTAPDYIESETLIVEKLAALEARTPEAVLKSLLEVGDDSISFRVTAQRADANSVPLSFAGSMIAGAQQLLLSSACTVLRPQVHPGRQPRQMDELRTFELIHG